MIPSNQFATATSHEEREGMLRMLAAVTFLIFFQAYMVAPIIPALAQTFSASVQTVALIVPAYLIPYGVATLLYGPLADRFGIRRVISASLTAFTVLAMATATATSIEQIAVWRILTGLGASGVVPLALVLVGRLFPYEQRGRPLGWLFGAMAGGMAVGSPLGAMLVPIFGWRGLFIIVGVAGAVALALLQRYGSLIIRTASPVASTPGELISGYVTLLSTNRAQRTYAYVFLNSMFHSGMFTWLGVYIERQYHLGPTGIGLAMLGYGVPGFLLGPVIGRAADRWGRAILIPVGLCLGATAAAALLLRLPLLLTPLAAMVLSLGYDTTQPLFAGIVTSLGGKRPGQAMGLNVFSLFVGFGAGSLIFGEIVRYSFTRALGTFAAAELLLALFALWAFRTERPSARTL
ncbi:MFS transporter [Paraburkholderia sp. RL18-103-BIB-C]|uniref:MFS transporter n=1 Tax=unclassified Paraburkholderia TaxID=2615204 RepID=UPI0038BB02BD